MSIQLNEIAKHFAAHTLFEGLSLQVGEKSRIGLIGRNGCGKSTVLKLIMGQLEPDAGNIFRSPGIRVNYLSQEPRITPHLTLEEEMHGVFTEINALRAKEHELIRKLELPDQPEDKHMALAHQLDTLHRELERLDAQDISARIGRTLKGLGFSLAEHRQKTGDFSGGWQMRISLAKVLLTGADILLLDEPTNHLDLDACEWLEGFLREYPGGLVIVSHDRRFLDQVTTETAELENGRLKVWPGNYTAHLSLKTAELEQQSSAYERQQKELTKQMAFVERFRASATRSTQAKSREKQLEKIERLEAPTQETRRMAMRFPPPQPSGRQVLTLRGISKAYGDKTIFSKLDASLERRQRVFLLGANGTGKTTLLRLILGLEPAADGSVEMGHNVITGYFSQNQLDTLDPDLSPFDTMERACPRLTNTELRSLLGRFLFTGDEVFKPVSVLSGGEKSKLALARLMMSGPNLLLLDEPTNHMDIPSKDVLTEALHEYEGSILCISHDRYFIQDLATHIWEIHNGHLLTYAGDYDYYLAKRDELRAQAADDTAPRVGRKAETPARPSKPASPLKARKELEKQLKKVERDILALESEIGDLGEKMNDPALQQDYPQLQAISETAARKQKQLATLNAEWTELAESLSE